MTNLQRMTAEILFLNPDDVPPGSATLIEHGFDVEVLDWVDDYGPTVLILATITTELRDEKFLDWVSKLARPLGGDVSVAGLAENMARHRAEAELEMKMNQAELIAHRARQRQHRV
jgi:hypothetical protein